MIELSLWTLTEGTKFISLGFRPGVVLKHYRSETVVLWLDDGSVRKVQKRAKVRIASGTQTVVHQEKDKRLARG